MRPTLSLLALTLLAGGLPALTPPAVAQQEAADQLPTEPDVLLADFIHLVKIARYDVAARYADHLLALDMPPEAFVDAVESGRFDNQYPRFREAVGLALQAEDFPELADSAAALEELYEQGKLAKARSPEEIARNIELLTSTMRGRDLGAQRLIRAGEYAVPQLFDALLDDSNLVRRERVRQVLVDLQSQAVIPLSIALEHIGPADQLIVLGVLGSIRYDQSVPFINAVRSATDSPEVRAEADRALARLGVGPSDALGNAWSFASLAERYYGEQSDVTSFPGEEFQLLWDYLPEAPTRTLVATPVRSEVYHEAMAMRLAERALRGAPQSADTLALWVAANLRREIQTPDGYANPAYAADRREAMYFAVASGMPVAQRVLARGIDDRNTVLSRRAIEAMSRTAGGAALWSGELARQPLLEALSYPNRRVQYDAALTLGAAQPKQTFAGAERVVPLLAGAVRDSASRFAMIVTDDAELYQGLRAWLERDGFTVLPRGTSVSGSADAIATVPGIDLAVTAISRERSLLELDTLRGSPRLAAVPALVLLPRGDAAALSPRYERDGSVFIRALGLSDREFASSVEQLLESAAGGPISADEAASYADRAVRVLRDLAVARNEALPVSEATPALIAAMADVEGDLERRIAEVLSWVSRPEAQRAVVETALAASGEQRLALLAIAAGSAQRFGNLLEPRHAQQVVELALKASGDEATSAAALMGSLNLPNDQVLPLVLGQ